MHDVNPDQSFKQLIGLLPLILPRIGVSSDKVALISETLSRDDALLNNQPNVAVMLELKKGLDALDEAEAQNDVQIRVMCGKCAYCNTITLK